MAEPLATPDDVTTLWPSAADLPAGQLTGLITKVSARLRQRMPTVDARIAVFEADPADPFGLDRDLVADVVGTIIKRFLVNPDGATNTSVSSDSTSISRGYALRGDKDIRGELYVADSDIAALMPAKIGAQAGTARTKSRFHQPAVPPLDDLTAWVGYDGTE